MYFIYSYLGLLTETSVTRFLKMYLYLYREAPGEPGMVTFPNRHPTSQVI